MSQETQDKKKLKMDSANGSPENGGKEGEAAAVSDNIGAQQLGDHDLAKNVDDCNDNMLETINSKLHRMSVDTSGLVNQIERLKVKNRDQDLKYEVLLGTTIKKDKAINIMAGRILELERRGMNHNIKILNIPEKQNENAKATVKDYLKSVNVNDCDIDIDIAHRNGPRGDGQASYARPIIAKIVKRQQVNNIIEQTKSDNYDKKAIRVTRQVPTETRQNTAKLYHVAAILKDIHSTAKVIVKEGKITVNGVKYKSPLAPPTLEEILQVPKEQIQVLHNINFYASDAIEEKSSVFRAFATPVVNRQDARLAYRAISRFPGTCSATHLIAAYKDMSNEFEYYDDGDHGLGRFVFDIIHEAKTQGIMVFLSREYGGRHLGALRFEIVQRVVDQAMDKMAAAISRNPQLANPANLQMPSQHPTQANVDTKDNREDSQPQDQKQHDNGSTDPEQQQHGLHAAEGGDHTSEATEMDTDGTTHKTNYPGSPIRNKQLGLATPPRYSSDTDDQNPFITVNYNSSKGAKSHGSSISLGQAVEGGDSFTVMMANRMRGDNEPGPHRGKRHNRPRNRNRGGQTGRQQLSRFTDTTSRTSSPKRDADGNIKQ